MVSTMVTITVVELCFEKKVRSGGFYRAIVYFSSLRTNRSWSVPALILAKLIVYAYGVLWLYWQYVRYANFMGILCQGY